MDVLLRYRGRVPRADRWSDKQKESQLYDATVYEKHVRDLASCDLRQEQAIKQHTSASVQSIVLLARDYAGTTERSWECMKKWKLLLSFRRLILLSICLVIGERGGSEAQITELMWWTSENEKRRKSILKGTWWMHQTILALVKRGWSIARATELFLLVPLSAERLVRLASRRPSDFVEGMENPDDATPKPFLTPSFTFPTLIEELCKGCSQPLVREEICTALGYQVALPTQHFSHVSHATNTIPRELHIELFIPTVIAGSAADSLPENPMRRKRRKRDVVPTYTNSNADAIQFCDTVIVEDHSTFDTELADFWTLVKHLKVDSFGEDLLLLGTDIQYEWDESGSQRAIDPKKAGLSERSATIFKDKETISSLLQASVKHGLLQEFSQDQERIYHLTRCSSDLLHNEDPYLDSLIFLCHICPKDEAFSQKFSATIKLLRPALTSWFQSLLEQPEVIRSMPSHETLTAACLAILRHGSSNATREAFLLLEHLRTFKVSVPSRLGIAVAQSASLRRQLRYDDSDDVIMEALVDITDNNAFQIYLLGQLYLSLVENSILRNEHTTALKWLNKIHIPTEKSPQNIPALMWRLFEQKWTTMGRVHRYMGDFEKAKDALKPCIGLRQHLGSNKLVNIARQLADVYVEVGEVESAKTLLDHHLTILQQKNRQDTIPYTRLLLSYADAELRLGQFDPAEARLEEVRTRFEAHQIITQTDQLDHVRALIACTRISLHKHKWPEVIERSTAALRLANQYECFTATNYYKGYLHKVRAISHLQLAQADMEAATECVRQPRHYMTGVGTYDRIKAHEECAEALAQCMSFDRASLDMAST